MATATEKTTTPSILKTKHIASKFGLKPVALRRVLRAMPAYADGVHTNYRWTEGKDDKAIADIGKAIEAAAKRKAEAKAKAQADLAAKAAAAKAEKK